MPASSRRLRRQRRRYCCPGAAVRSTGAETMMGIRCTPPRNPRDRLYVPMEPESSYVLIFGKFLHTC